MSETAAGTADYWAPPNQECPFADAMPGVRHIIRLPAEEPAPTPTTLAPTGCGHLAVVPDRPIEIFEADRLPMGMCFLCVAVMLGTVEIDRETQPCRQCSGPTTHGRLCAACRQAKHAAWWPTRPGAAR